MRKTASHSYHSITQAMPNLLWAAPITQISTISNFQTLRTISQSLCLLKIICQSERPVFFACTLVGVKRTKKWCLIGTTLLKICPTALKPATQSTTGKGTTHLSASISEFGSNYLKTQGLLAAVLWKAQLHLGSLKRRLLSAMLTMYLLVFARL